MSKDKQQTTEELLETIDDFTRAYLICALWSSCDENSNPLDDNYDLDDFDPKSLQSMIEDCKDFQEHQAELLSKSELSEDQAGHDFWLTRNGHGAGFWDRGLGKVGDELSDACKPYGSVDLYVGDDKRIYSN